MGSLVDVGSYNHRWRTATRVKKHEYVPRHCRKSLLVDQKTRVEDACASAELPSSVVVWIVDDRSWIVAENVRYLFCCSVGTQEARSSVFIRMLIHFATPTRRNMFMENTGKKMCGVCGAASSKYVVGVDSSKKNEWLKKAKPAVDPLVVQRSPAYHPREPPLTT